MTRHSAPATDPAPEFFSRQVSDARRFYLDLEPPASRTAGVVCGGFEHAQIDYQIHRQSFPFYSIEYVLRGQGRVKLKGRVHALQPGRVFSYGPGVSHDIASNPADPLAKYFVDFTGRRAKTLLSSCGLAPGCVSQLFPPNELELTFNELIHCGVKGARHGAALCDKLLECLVLQISDSRAPVEAFEQPAFNTYNRCRQHVQQNFRRLKTLEQISAECHVNHAYLCRLFRRYDHQTPYQFLVRLKMNYAAQLLELPDTLVKQVSEEAGFDDPFHFSRTFKRVFGLSPDGFRRLR